MTPQSPSDHLAQHGLTAEMLRIGVTPAQLDAIRFRANNKGWDFDQWLTDSPADLPAAALGFVRAYCALKWIVLEDPPATRNRRDAWDLIKDTLMAPLVASAIAARAAQNKNSKLGAKARKIYSDADRERWKVLATEPEIARHPSKRRRAQLIAEREGRNRAAIATIRKVI